MNLAMIPATKPMMIVQMTLIAISVGQASRAGDNRGAAAKFRAGIASNRLGARLGRRIENRPQGASLPCAPKGFKTHIYTKGLHINTWTLRLNV